MRVVFLIGFQGQLDLNEVYLDVSYYMMYISYVFGREKSFLKNVSSRIIMCIPDHSFSCRMVK